MAALFTACPTTGQMIPVGIETDKVSLSLAPSFIAQVFCPHCKTNHQWSKDTTWLEESGTLIRPE